MEVTKKIFPKNECDIYSILNLEQYLILGGNNRYDRYLHKKKCRSSIEELREGFIHVYKKEVNNKLNLAKKIDNAQKSTVECIELVNDNSYFWEYNSHINKLIN